MLGELLSFCVHTKGMRNPHTLKLVRGRESPRFKTYSPRAHEWLKGKNSRQYCYLFNSWKAKPRPEGMPVISRDYYYALSDWKNAVYNSALQP
jgi:hypothetical protein